MISNTLHIVFLICCTLAISTLAYGQKEHARYSINKDKAVVFSVDLEKVQEPIDSILISFGINKRLLEKVWSEKRDTSFNGWKLTLFSDRLIELTKGLEASEDLFFEPDDMVILDDSKGKGNLHTFFPYAAYGVNEFKNEPSVYDTDDGYTHFVLRDTENARSVYLSGSFNEWSTLDDPMVRTSRGWEARIKLKPGKHLYKFIVDANWVKDPNNMNQEDDAHEGDNSIYYKPNHTFYLGGYSDAKRVYVAGSFNDWRKKELRLERKGLIWELDMYVKEGTHAYKFIVDGEWVFDPSNQVRRPDIAGNLNNYFSVGDTFDFNLNGYKHAREVYVAGDFNVWNEQELRMERTSSGWSLPYVLAPGTYEYKFIVDGNWITDPGNPKTAGSGKYQNSVLTVQPNVRIRLPGYRDAEEVFITGSFNGWKVDGIPMVREDGHWVAELYLRPGKYTYKFIVDGTWMSDPTNELWETNEYGTKNSVLWIDPSDVFQIDN